MPVFKSISVKELIAKVISDLEIEDERIRINDMIEWTGEALRKIGGFSTLVNRVTGIEDEYGTSPIIKLENYRAELPCDLVSITQLFASLTQVGRYYPVRSATGSTETRHGDLSLQTSGSWSYPPDMYDKINFISDIYSISYSDAFAMINSNPNMETVLDKVFVNTSQGISSSIDVDQRDLTYTVNPPYVDLNIRDGYLMIAYKAIPTDCEGFPLIPDDEDFKEAVYWYINMKLLYPKWRSGQVRDAVYEHSESEWKKKKLAAYANVVMPSTDEMESIKNAWLRLIPKINEFDSGFKFVGNRERTKLKNNE